MKSTSSAAQLLQWAVNGNRQVYTQCVSFTHMFCSGFTHTQTVSSLGKTSEGQKKRKKRNKLCKEIVTLSWLHKLQQSIQTDYRHFLTVGAKTHHSYLKLSFHCFISGNCRLMTHSAIVYLNHCTFMSRFFHFCFWTHFISYQAYKPSTAPNSSL